MADLTVSSTQMAPLTNHGAVVLPGKAGAAITVGYLVYQAADGDWEHADGNVSATLAAAQGVAVASRDGETSIAAGDPVSVCVFGPVGGFTDVTAGANYYVSDTVGRISDAAGTYSRIVGYGVQMDGQAVLFVHPQQNDPAS